MPQQAPFHHHFQFGFSPSLFQAKVNFLDERRSNQKNLLQLLDLVVDMHQRLSKCLATVIPNPIAFQAFFLQLKSVCNQIPTQKLTASIQPCWFRVSTLQQARELLHHQYRCCTICAHNAGQFLKEERDTT